MDAFILIFLVVAVIMRKRERDGTAGPRPAAPGGGPRTPKYGMWDHLTDSYRDSWRRETDKLIARRDARDKARAAGRPPEGGWWRRRWDAAEDRRAAREEARRRRQQAQRPHQTREPTRPDQPPRPLFPDPPAPRQAPTPPDDDSNVVRFRPRVVPDPPPPPDPEQTPTPEPSGEAPANPAPTSSEGAPPMSGPTGEVNNHEQHIAELDATIKELEQGIDLCNAVIGTSTTLRGQVDELQSKYGPVAAAAQTRADHLTAMHVDQTTTGHAAEGADALDPNAVNRYHDEAENIEAGAKALRERLEKALESAKAERAEAIKRYADAQETVNSDLSGDATYLGGGNGGTSTTTAPAPQPEPAGASR